MRNFLLLEIGNILLKTKNKLIKKNDNFIIFNIILETDEKFPFNLLIYRILYFVFF